VQHAITVIAGEVGAPNHQASHEGTGANVCGPHDKRKAHPSAQVALLDGSVGDQVVQGSVIVSVSVI